MCDFNNLCADEQGFILRCKSCGHYQVGFCNVMFSLNKTDFEKLSIMITDLSQKDFQDKQTNARHLVIPTPYYGVNLLLCQDEILQLKALITKAEEEELAGAMLALFSDN